MKKILGKMLRYYADENDRTGRMKIPIAVVLVEGQIGDYAAYVGIGSDEWIAKFGDKLSFEEACCHFPGGQLKEELYRK